MKTVVRRKNKPGVKGQTVENVFTVQLTESELILITGLLWNAELKQDQLRESAERHGRMKQADARRESSAKANALANRLLEIGAAS